MRGESLLVALVTSVVTYLATRTESRYVFKGKQTESKSNTEGIYVQNMEMILTEYKEQVNSFRDEVQLLRDENKSLKDDFRKFKENHQLEMEEYKKYTELLEEENETLKEVVVDLEVEIKELQEGGKE